MIFSDILQLVLDSIDLIPAFKIGNHLVCLFTNLADRSFLINLAKFKLK